MASFNVDYDAASWVLVPFEFPTAAGESEHDWVTRLAQEQRERGYRETRRTGTLEDYFRRLVVIARDATSDVEHDSIWALVSSGAPGFVTAAVDLSAADEPFEQFLDAVAARRDFQYEPATVTRVGLPNLGDGVRVVRHDFDEHRAVYVSLYYMFRIGGLELMLSTQSFDPPAVDRAIPLFEELLAGVHITAD